MPLHVTHHYLHSCSAVSTALTAAASEPAVLKEPSAGAREKIRNVRRKKAIGKGKARQGKAR